MNLLRSKFFINFGVSVPFLLRILWKLQGCSQEAYGVGVKRISITLALFPLPSNFAEKVPLITGPSAISLTYPLGILAFPGGVCLYISALYFILILLLLIYFFLSFQSTGQLRSAGSYSACPGHTTQSLVHTQPVWVIHPRTRASQPSSSHTVPLSEIFLLMPTCPMEEAAHS